VTLNLENLKKKYIKNFHNDEKLCSFVLTDVLFGFNEISEFLKEKNIKSVLEIGSGTGILLNELKNFFPNINFLGLDPNESGYYHYREIYKSLVNPGFSIENKQIENFSSEKKFDLIFSINVFEHVNDWKKYIEKTNNLLTKNGLNVILCPNYDFPYEPHFVIPIIINKKITQFIFNKKIKKHEVETNEIGMWKAINFVGKREVKKILNEKKYNYFFDLNIQKRMISRATNDKDFKNRQGLAAQFAIIAKYLYLDKLIFNLLKVPFPYMKLIIKKNNFEPL